MSRFKTFNGYEVMDAKAREDHNILAEQSPAIGVSDGHIIDGIVGRVIDFTAYGKSTQNGTPTPDAPIDIKSVGDMGWFDGELLQGGRSTDNGTHNSGTAYVVTSKNKIPCKQGDIVTIHTDDNPQFLAIVYFNGDTFVIANYEKNVNESSFTVPSGVDSFYFNVQMASTETITPQTAKHICVTINGKYALIVDSNDDRKYIPLSAPLRGLGEVTDVASLSECEVDRKFAEVVYDGSDDENWSLKGIGCELYLNNTNSGNALCTHYEKNNGVSWDDLQGNEFNIIGTVLRIKDNTHQSTLDEWKAHLQANPITVIYELAESTTESIEPFEIATYDGITNIICSDNADCEVVYYRSNEDGKKMQELDNRMMTAEDTINNLESNAVDVAGDIEDIKSSMLNPNLKALTPSDEPYTIASGTLGNVTSFKNTWLSRPLNDCEYLLIEITHRNNSKQIVTIPSIMLSEGSTYSFPFNDVQNTIFGAYITIDTFTRYSIGLYGTAPSDITFMLYNYGHPISVG